MTFLLFCSFSCPILIIAYTKWLSSLSSQSSYCRYRNLPDAMYDRTKSRKSGVRVDEMLEREKSRALGHALRAAINTPIQVCGVVCVYVWWDGVVLSGVDVWCDVMWCVYKYIHTINIHSHMYTSCHYTAYRAVQQTSWWWPWSNYGNHKCWRT